MAAAPDKDEGLKRLGGGRWQTRDERFTIEPQSGTWAVVDAEQTDDLGLPLVRGPFKSLGAAKEAIEAARGTAAPTSKLKNRAAVPAAAPRTTRTAGGSKAPSKGRAEAKPPRAARSSRPSRAGCATSNQPSDVARPSSSRCWPRLARPILKGWSGAI